ncbi:hypothetical protein FOZ61_002395, partial [Perkinsus olseni]
ARMSTGDRVFGSTVPGELAKQWSGHEITAHPSLKRHAEELHSSGLDLRRRKMDPRVILSPIFSSAKPVRSRGLGHLCGSATEADVTAVSEVVGRAAERLGSPVRAKEIDEGLSLGVESPLKPSGVLPEAKSKAQSDGRSGEAAAACGCHGSAPQPDEEDDFLLFKHDITGAYKHLFLAESERPRTSVRLGQVVFESKALPFGAAGSPYHWCRGSAGVVRLIGALLRWILIHEKFLSLLYIEDGLLAVRRKVYWLARSLAVLVWEVLN